MKVRVKMQSISVATIAQRLPRLCIIFAVLRVLAATWRFLWGRRRCYGQSMRLVWWTSRGRKLAEVPGERRQYIGIWRRWLGRTESGRRLWFDVRRARLTIILVMILLLLRTRRGGWMGF